MNERKSITRFWRGVAAVMAVVWLFALAVCSVHCSSAKVSVAKGFAAKGCCKKGAESQSDRAGLPCLAVKAVVPGAHVTADLPDQFQVATVVLVAEILSFLRVEAPAMDRPAARPDRVIAHEVYLGSAARSHGPPFFV